MKRHYKYLLLLLGLVAIAVFLSILLFSIQFSGRGRSNNISDWGDFATYFSLTVSVINTMIVGTLTFMLFKYNQERDEEAKHRDKQLNRPIITFRRFDQYEFYSICNIGNGAAINIKVKSHLNADETKWIKSHSTYSLRDGEEKPMIWTRNCKTISAEYTDVIGNVYCSFMDNDTIKVFCLSESKETENYPNEVRLNGLNVISHRNFEIHNEISR